MFGGRRSWTVAALALLVLVPAPAHAQNEGPPPCTEPCHRPDALIRRRNEAVAIGGDVYNWNSNGQTEVGFLTREGTIRYVVRLENDGTDPDDLVVAGTRNTTYFGIRYYVADQEVSARVRHGSFRFDDVLPGEARFLRMEVTAKPAAPLRSRVEARIAVRSGDQVGPRDRVKAVVYRGRGAETVITGATFTNRATAERWAQDEGASERFVYNARLYWELAPPRGIRPEVAYAQSGKETAHGNFGGVIDATFNNPCGLKTTEGGANDDPDAHQRFVNWRQGITACIDHLALYAGAPGYPRMDTPDPRHFPTIYATAPTVERLGGRWAPDPDYGRSIVADYLNPLLGS